MPIWCIYHPPTVFTTPESKSALAKSITSVYANPPASLPAFYVAIYFIPVPETDIFVAGEPHFKRSKPFVRFVIDHIAIKLPDEDAAYARTTAQIDNALKPHIADMGYDWEYHCTETERRLWKINGIAPPPWGSEGEAKWRNEGYPTPL